MHKPNIRLMFDTRCCNSRLALSFCRVLYACSTICGVLTGVIRQRTSRLIRGGHIVGDKVTKSKKFHTYIHTS